MRNPFPSEPLLVVLGIIVLVYIIALTRFL
jgi:hypothetical protein